MKANYDPKTGKYRCRTQETYKGVIWTCTGISRKGATEAKRAWQRNREAKIAEIDGKMEIKTGRVRLDKAMRGWYDLYIRGKTTHGRPRSAQTISTDEIQMGKIFEVLGGMLVCDVDADVLQAYFNRLAAGGTGDSIIHKRWILLNQFFAKNNPQNNPLVLCTKPQTVQAKDRWNVAQEDEIDTPLAYTDAEMAKLTSILQDTPAGRNREQAQERGRMLVVIMWQFLRLGEAAELRVKDVDFGSGVVRIRRQYDEVHKCVVMPKDNSRRDMPIAEYSRDILMMACTGKRPEDLVFCGDIHNAHGGRVLRGALRDTLTAACRAAGLARHVVHDLRHDGISYYVRRGIKPQSIQKWAGHSSLSVTLDIYYRSTGVDDPVDAGIMRGDTQTVHVPETADVA